MNDQVKKIKRIVRDTNAAECEIKSQNIVGYFFWLFILCNVAFLILHNFSETEAGIYSPNQYLRVWGQVPTGKIYICTDVSGQTKILLMGEKFLTFGISEIKISSEYHTINEEIAVRFIDGFQEIIYLKYKVHINPEQVNIIRKEYISLDRYLEYIHSTIRSDLRAFAIKYTSDKKHDFINTIGDGLNKEIFSRWCITQIEFGFYPIH